MKYYLCNNPAVLQRADPSIYRHIDGYYYFTASTPEFDRIEIRRAKEISDLAGAETHTIWRKKPDGKLSANIWAPEIHFINGCWYIYFAAARSHEPENGLFTHRMYVLQNAEDNPLTGQWVERGKIATAWESFSLDATTFIYNEQQYLVWAQNDPEIAGNSNLYISKMKTPWTLTGNTVLISKPEYEWETRGFLVNEGPAVLIKNEKIFITYSCSATDENYCLGLLHADTSDDLLAPESWSKSEKPVFTTSYEYGQYGPGHNSFTVSKDEKTDLMVYHARNYRDIIGDPLSDPNRHTRIQPITWIENGFPDFGNPVKDGPLFIDL